MNLLKRGDTPHEAMERIGSLARRRQVQDPEYQPIKVLVNDYNKKTFKITSCDVFYLTTVSTQRGDVKAIDIARTTDSNFNKSVTFIIDPNDFMVYAYIPKTETNLNLLASLIASTGWAKGLVSVEDMQIRDEVNRRADKLKSEGKVVRDELQEHSEVGWQQHKDGTEAAVETALPEPSVQKDVSNEIMAKAKKKLEQNRVLMTKLKSLGTSYWLRREYKNALAAAVEAVRAEAKLEAIA